MSRTREPCAICSRSPTELHHIFPGKNRAASDRIKATVFLCHEHHRGTYGVHGREGAALSLVLKKLAQERFEQTRGTREEFMRIIGRNYLAD